MGPNMDGDASMLSNGADAATHPKSAKTTTRAEKGDADTQGIDVSLLHVSGPKLAIWDKCIPNHDLLSV